MSSQSSGSSDPGDLRSKVTAWLNGTGAPVEMRVARAMQAVGLEVLQSVYYGDADENVSREIDVVATRQVQAGACEPEPSFGPTNPPALICPQLPVAG